MVPSDSYQTGRARGPPSVSSSSSNENKRYGSPGGHQKKQVNAGGNTGIPFNEQAKEHAKRLGPFNLTRSIVNPLELRIWASGLPMNWTALDVYNAFSCLGNISRIDIRGTSKGANVTFRPAPETTSWAGLRFRIKDTAGNTRWIETKNETKSPFMHALVNTDRKLPERITIPVASIQFGVMESESTMLGMHSLASTRTVQASLTMNMAFKALFLNFPVEMVFTKPSGEKDVRECEFRMRFTPTQIHDARMTQEANSSRCLYFTCDTPPLVHRKTSIPQMTFDNTYFWDENKLWFRQTSIDEDPSAIKSSVKLREGDCIIDLGRWLTYRLSISRETFNSLQFHDILQVLADHNIKVSMDEDTNLRSADKEDLWEWLDAPKPKDVKVEENPFLAEMHQMTDDNVYLPFTLRYQLEVCISLGLLHECNMTKTFLSKLAALDSARAVKILEKVVDDKKRYFDPEKVFRLQNQVSVVSKKRPSYCTKIPSAVVTPTTIYFATPVLETSNRVIRQFQHFEDRFLRVKFTDERHKGKIFPSEDKNDNELFSRVSRTMTQGITIGDRHYEFLAFGSSQFREHGAYFFASTNTLTADMIRKWMGNFTEIKVVAKYCARLGQCFSTTRAIPHPVTIQKIPDVMLNGNKYCATDGAGMTSPLMARLIATHFGLPNSEHDYPSMFQFRMGGCKGVLQANPALRGTVVQIRPSQEKFPAEFQGLEICRISQFSTAYLNQQIILVLSSLGVPDEVFLKKLRIMLSEFEEAMNNEQRALELLQKNIDYNQMTIGLSGIICDGFMETQEPFTVSCLRLWKSWTLKYLKEKARICVDQGSFVLAGPDETATLRGDFKASRILADETDTLKGSFSHAGGEESTDDDLPEIFLQVPDPDKPNKYKVIQDECFIARNPSLHPGDIRRVRAVDVPALHHMKDALILPVTGYRDLANMCSGGDLDGDDYMVIWDKTLFPKEDSHPPMDYTGPTPVQSKKNVTPDDMARFFVQHIKHDNLARIATSHRYWADQLDEGIKDPKCLELARLHSMAVDYAKTGVPAEVPADLRVKQWPHWAERKNTSKSKEYKSKKILGKLYDAVKADKFKTAAWDLPFDERILSACEPSEEMLQDAREVKAIYDEAMRRIMTQFGIQTELEVFTTFVLGHHQDVSDYKLAETMGEVTEALKQTHRDICYEKAGTDSKTKDWTKLKPFIVAMYKVTSEEIAQAYAETKKTVTVGGKQVQVRNKDFASMPFMSFPWIFTRELGMIATKGGSSTRMNAVPRPTMPKKTTAKRQIFELLGDDFAPKPLSEANTSEGAVRPGEYLNLYHDENKPVARGVEGMPSSAPAPAPNSTSAAAPTPTSPPDKKPSASATTNENLIPSPKPNKEAWPQSIRDEQLQQAMAAIVEAEDEVKRKARIYQEAGLPFDSSFSRQPQDTVQGGVEEEVKVQNEGEGEEGGDADDEWEGEEVRIEFDEEPSALDRLAALVGTGSQ